MLALDYAHPQILQKESQVYELIAGLLKATTIYIAGGVGRR